MAEQKMLQHIRFATLYQYEGYVRWHHKRKTNINSYLTHKTCQITQ